MTRRACGRIAHRRSGGKAEDGAAPQVSGVSSLLAPHPCESLGYLWTLGAFPGTQKSGCLGSNLHSSVRLMWVAAGAA